MTKKPNTGAVLVTKKEVINPETLAECYDVVGYDAYGPIYQIKEKYRSKSMGEHIGGFIRAFLP